jgi:hypothetical protein
MKKKQLVVLLIVLLPATLSSVRSNAADPASDRHPRNEEAIETIRNRYAQVNRDLHMCQQIKRELEGYSSEGGELTDYLLNSSVRKAIALFYHETGQTLREYYFWDDQLFFVFEVRSHYDKIFGRVVSKDEGRFYFSNGRLVRWLDGKQENSIASSDAKQLATELLDTAKEFSDMSQTIVVNPRPM